MKGLEALLGQRKLVLTLAVLLSFLGIVSWLTMTRQEDPRLPEYFGQVVAQFPGADAETVERLVLEPLEDELAEVDELHEIVSTARAELAVVELELSDRIDRDGTDAAWDRVRQALENARAELPEGVSEPRLDDRQQDQTSVVYALTGPVDLLALADAAEILRDEMLSVPGVARVEIVADPGEQITLELDDAEIRRLGLTPSEVAAQIGSRTRILPGGSVRVADRQMRLRPETEFESLDEIRATPILLPSGETLPLEAVARVELGPVEPARTRMRHQGRTAVGIGIVPRKGIHVVDFGERVAERAAEIAPRLAPVEMDRMIFQPARVADRLAGLSRSLATGALVVAGVLVLFMGLRMGLLVASVVPLVTFSALAVYNLGGGVLQQMSIAAVVIALGMLVDNAVVMAETIQHRIDSGEASSEAALGAVRELAIPLAGATGTTLAAFLPMLLAPGLTAEFTRAIPVMILLTLTVSYLYAVFVTPALGAVVLKPRERSGPTLFDRLASSAGGLAVGRPALVIVTAVVVVGLSFAGMGLVRQEFFPESDRNQLVVDLKLPEGSHLDATDRAAARLEASLAERPEVVAVSSFLGRSAPHFYYNLSQIPWSPPFAQLLVETTSTEVLDDVMGFTRDVARAELPGTEVVIRKLEQGPPVEAPVEVRLYGHELEALHAGAEAVVDVLRDVPGTTDVRHDLSLGAPVLRVSIDDAAAARRGLGRPAVAEALFRTSRGMNVGWYRAGDDPVPVVLRSRAGEDTPVSELESLDVSAPGAAPVPLAQVARLTPEWRPGAVRHRNRVRTVSVLSQLQPGLTYGDVVERLDADLAELELPAGVRVEMGGAAETSGEANNAMMQALPAGILLLLGILMAEFRSFRRMGLVLVTVPLAAAGVVPGLLFGGHPFGFMSLLGVLALAGVVVNNAIVLLEVIEARRKEGASVPEAVRDGVERRLRPIVLTTVTTVVGLLPLALSNSTLWPPLAWAMISGLIASTFLTLLVVPALYLLLFRPGRVLRLPGLRRGASATASGLILVVALGSFAATPIKAQPPSLDDWTEAGEIERVTFAETLERAARRPRVEAEQGRAAALDWVARAERRAARWPSVVGSAEVIRRSNEQLLETPIGELEFGDEQTETASLTLIQPLLIPDRLFYGAPAAEAEARAAVRRAERAAQEAAALAAETWLDARALEARLDATDAFVESLEGRLAETEARVTEGRTLEAEALKVRLTLDQARQDRLQLLQLARLVARDLGRAVGLDGPAWPGGTAPTPESPSALDALVPRALETRPDLAALRESVQARELERKAVRAGAYPRLEATVSGIWTAGSPFEDETYAQGGLRVSWNPFASGTRSARAAAVARETDALEDTLLEARRGVRVELTRALTDWEIAQGNVKVGETGVTQATETLRVERERHQAGRITTNDLLDAEAALRDRQTLRDLARLDLLRARVRLDLAVGTLP